MTAHNAHFNSTLHLSNCMQRTVFTPSNYLPLGRALVSRNGAAWGLTCPASCFGARTLENIYYTPQRPYTPMRPTTDELYRISSTRHSHIGHPASRPMMVRCPPPPVQTVEVSESRPYRHSPPPFHAYYTSTYNEEMNFLLLSWKTIQE